MNDSETDLFAQRVYAEQVDLLYRPLLLSVAATVVAGALFVVAQWHVIAPLLIAEWVLLLALVTFLRLGLALAYRRRQPPADEARTWGRLFVVGAGLAGLTWGAGSVMLFPADSLDHQVIVVLVMTGMSAGATTTLSAVPAATMVFLVPTMLPVTLLFVAQDNELSRIVAAMLLLATGFLFSAARSSSHSITEGIRLRLTAQENQRSLAAAKRAAEQASQAKTDFLANVSHEIRTPMNVILGMIHMAGETELDDRQRGYLRKAQRSAEDLLGIINNLLDFARPELPDDDPAGDAFRLDLLLQRVQRDHLPRAAAKGLDLRIELDPAAPLRVLGDAVGIARVLHNLVDNAVKFTLSGSVSVSVSELAREADGVRLRFAVRDTGPGIAADQREGIFQPFSQADSSSTRRHGGTGMGLAVSAKLVQALGGRIVLDSTLGQGSEFAFVLRLEVPADDSARTEARVGEPSAVLPGGPPGAAPEGSTHDPAELARLLVRFRAQAEDYDTACEETLAAMLPILRQRDQADTAARLQALVASYAFAEAAELAAGLQPKTRPEAPPG